MHIIQDLAFQKNSILFTDCYKHLSQIRKKLRIETTAMANAWRYFAKKTTDVGVQIDLLFDRKDDAITMDDLFDS
jgi:hypothetical protein